MRLRILLAAFFALIAVSVSAQTDGAAQTDSISSVASEPVTVPEPAAKPVSEKSNFRPRLLWGLGVDVKFDNHENDELRYLAPAVNSMTLFSIRFVPTVGLGWDHVAKNGKRAGQTIGRHSVLAGGSFTIDISENRSARPIEPLIYYNYHSDRFDLFAGKFERRNLIGAYSRAIFAGIATFYDNVVDGFALQYHEKQGYLELVLDWDGIKTARNREGFRILSAGEFNPAKSRAMRWFAMGYSFDLYHLASSQGGGEGVVDHFAVNPWIGARFEQLAPWFEKLRLDVGWMQMFDRDRMGDGRWMLPGGGTIDFTVQKWRVGIRNRLYWGQPLMPLRGVAGTAPLASRIYKGDPFYSAIAATRIYNYTYIYWTPNIGYGVNLEVSAGLHTDGKKVGFQQTLGVSVLLDRQFFHSVTRRKK